ncbi:MAG: RrF2 family transcriptional regulator [Coprococcus sp.]
MKVSTKGRYALRLMTNIASRTDGKPVSIKDIASSEDISDKYLEQIIALLHSGGLVRSVRGPQGGYLLRKSPEEITVGMVLRLTEGTLSPVPCVDDEETNCDREADCTTLNLWRRLNKAISDVIDNTTIADLCNNRPEAGDEYCI